MKIRNLLIVTILIFVIVLIIISLSIFLTNQKLTIIAQEQDISGEIELHASHLSLISNQYYLSENEIELDNWRSNITAIYTELSKLDNSTDHYSLISTLEEDTKAVDNSFNDTISYLMNAPRNQSLRIVPEFQAIWSQLTNKIEKLDSDQTQFSALLLNEGDQAQVTNIILIAISLIAFGLYLAVNYFITYRRTLRSIAELQEGIKTIGSGDLDYSVKTEKRDEIGILSESVNEMAVHLKQLTAKLQEQERMVAIGQTAGMVGHDLRNPLQTISGQVYLAKGELHEMPASELKDSLEENIQEIEEQISYMDKIVSDLQTFVKPVQVQKTEFNLNTFIVELLAEIKIPDNINSQIKIDEACVLSTDKQLLKRVFTNLLTNAIQAMPKGGQLTVNDQVTDDKKRVRIIVVDTGVGIPDNIKSKIFTPLFTTKSRGQGFGLAVCKRVIETLGGTITFESEQGKGTQFVVELPYSPDLS